LSFLDILGKGTYALLMKSTISSKGQVTVPIEVRARLGLVPGTVVEFEIHNGGVYLRKGSGGAHPVDRLFGRLKLSKPVDDLLDEMRGPRVGSSTRARRKLRTRR
jgi:AbrB family looped-hinge helix DNA binding protein